MISLMQLLRFNVISKYYNWVCSDRVLTNLNNFDVRKKITLNIIVIIYAIFMNRIWILLASKKSVTS